MVIWIGLIRFPSLLIVQKAMSAEALMQKFGNSEPELHSHLRNTNNPESDCVPEQTPRPRKGLSESTQSTRGDSKDQAPARLTNLDGNEAALNTQVVIAWGI